MIKAIGHVAGLSVMLLLEGRMDVVISGIRLSNPDGPCVVVRNSQRIRIERSELGPCQGGVSIEGSSGVAVSDSVIRDTGQAGNGVDVIFSQDVAVTNNRIERVRTGVYALGSSGVKVERNTFRNVLGPFPRGQFVQFNQVSGRGNRVTCNVGENVPGESWPEDAISMFASNGEPGDPIRITGNKIRGGGPGQWGGGIMLGDGGGSYQVAADNVLVDPGQYGMAIAGGHDMRIVRNRIYARQQPFTNAGIYVWNQYAPPCYGHIVRQNQVQWTNREGVPNPRWDGTNCGVITGWDNNDWNAPLLAAVFDAPVCR